MGMFHNEVVVITGAGRGIGRSHALSFAEEGAKVVVNDLGTSLDGSGSITTVEEPVTDLCLRRTGAITRQSRTISEEQRD